jgi:hypothetical protein
MSDRSALITTETAHLAVGNPPRRRLCTIFAVDQPASSTLTRREMNWQPARSSPAAPCRAERKSSLVALGGGRRRSRCATASQPIADVELT